LIVFDILALGGDDLRGLAYAQRVYAGARGHAMIDRELYLPQSWGAGPAAARVGRCFPTTSSS
jgi:hypothetical protein